MTYEAVVAYVRAVRQMAARERYPVLALLLAYVLESAEVDRAIVGYRGELLERQALSMLRYAKTITTREACDGSRGATRYRGGRKIILDREER